MSVDLFVSTGIDRSEIERQAKAEFARDAQLRAEFDGDETAYISYRLATSAGLVRVLERRK